MSSPDQGKEKNSMSVHAAAPCRPQGGQGLSSLGYRRGLHDAWYRTGRDRREKPHACIVHRGVDRVDPAIEQVRAPIQTRLSI